MDSLYLLFKVLHFFALISWMVGLWYLPRLFVYQHATKPGSPEDVMLNTMARKLRLYIMLPAVILLFVAGLAMATMGGFWSSGWFHAKFSLVLLLLAYHHWLALKSKQFLRQERPLSAKAWRYINEVPTIMVVLIITLAVWRPF